MGSDRTFAGVFGRRRLCDYGKSSAHNVWVPYCLCSTHCVRAPGGLVSLVDDILITVDTTSAYCAWMRRPGLSVYHDNGLDCKPRLQMYSVAVNLYCRCFVLSCCRCRLRRYLKVVGLVCQRHAFIDCICMLGTCAQARTRVYIKEGRVDSCQYFQCDGRRGHKSISWHFHRFDFFLCACLSLALTTVFLFFSR